MRMLPPQGQQALAQPWDQGNYLSYLQASNSQLARAQAAAEVEILKKALKDQDATIRTLERVVASMQQTNKSIQEKHDEACQRIAEMAEAYDAHAAPEQSKEQNRAWFQDIINGIGNFFAETFEYALQSYAENKVALIFEGKKSRRKKKSS